MAARAAWLAGELEREREAIEPFAQPRDRRADIPVDHDVGVHRAGAIQ